MEGGIKKRRKEELAPEEMNVEARSLMERGAGGEK
jgi:hypothetical protein